MSDDDLIRRGDALAAVYEADSLELVQHGENRIADRIAALPAVTVGVKPLVWDDRDYEWCWWSEDGDYRVRLDGAFHCDKHGVTLSSHTSLEAAKAAAQADYEARILAALEPVAAPDPAAIREAALLADLAQGPMRGELMEPWIRRMMNRAAALIQKGAADDR